MRMQKFYCCLPSYLENRTFQYDRILHSDSFTNNDSSTYADVGSKLFEVKSDKFVSRVVELWDSGRLICQTKVSSLYKKPRSTVQGLGFRVVQNRTLVQRH